MSTKLRRGTPSIAYVCESCISSLRTSQRTPTSPSQHLRRLTTASAQPESRSSPSSSALDNSSSSSSAPPTALPSPSSFTSPSINTYLTTSAPSASQLLLADRFFAAGNPRFLFSSPTYRDFPATPAPEVAFLGRSNVGKSSLLNGLLGRTKQRVAHVSKKPGRTRTMNAFLVGPGEGGVRDVVVGLDEKGRKKVRKEPWVGAGGGNVVVVDMPGYGKGSRKEWGEEIFKYLSKRDQLRRAFLLVDAEHGLKDSDTYILNGFRANGIPHEIVLSKADKILLPRPRMPSPEAWQRHLAHMRHASEKVYDGIVRLHGGRGMRLNAILACSGEKRDANGKLLGMDALRWAVLQAAGLGAAQLEQLLPRRRA
ncbi:P-loop containing nucleoside triphosphate hydrolase protein [Lineolata rhizophorae]|uniref:P-loop containing nucleoside triphosphate hydrolase protein n=1 Tax=Lineolata rhizophorae TaxID=578093 RepID=A0A6A6P9D5_9PEZI|nr:P-loop containing nucleoside triphosphate hydrolase protein [Lineolata rhizophorae]